MKEENTAAKEYEDFLKEKIDYYGNTEAARHFAAEAYANKRVTEAIEELTKYNTELSSENRRMDRLIDGLIKTLWTKSTK